MSDVLAVARNDFRSVRRSRLLWGVVLIYVAFVAIVFFPAGDEITVTDSAFGAVFLTALLLPLVAITGTYLAVAGERESNTIRFLLSQPTRRSSVVLGKFLSRGLMLLLALSLALLVAAGLVATQYDVADFGPLVTFFGLTTLLVGAYTAAALGISAAVASRSRAIAGTLALYFVTVVLSLFPGVSIQSALREILGNILGLAIDDAVYALIASLLSPAQAYVNAMVGLLDVDATIFTPADPPVYLQPTAQSGVIVLWILGSLLVGILVFGRAEIG